MGIGKDRVDTIWREERQKVVKSLQNALVCGLPTDRRIYPWVLDLVHGKADSVVGCDLNSSESVLKTRLPKIHQLRQGARVYRGPTKEVAG